TRHPPPETAMAVGAAERKLEHGTQARRSAHEARRRTRQGARRLASRRCEGGGGGRDLQLYPQPEEIQKGVAPRGPVSSAHQSLWSGPCPAVAILYPVGRGRGRL